MCGTVRAIAITETSRLEVRQAQWSKNRDERLAHEKTSLSFLQQASGTMPSQDIHLRQEQCFATSQVEHSMLGCSKLQVSSQPQYSRIAEERRFNAR